MRAEEPPLQLYAKTPFNASPAGMSRRLAELAGRCPEVSLQEAREWLVFAGQIEQAALDGGAAGGTDTVTDCAAELFLARLGGREVDARRMGLLQALASATPCEDLCEVRIPEGFAWYGLYPESYAATALRWARQRPGSSAAVVGLRSIGTGLGALVAAALREQGVRVSERLTVRPEGHPFARQVRPLRLSRDVDSVIVVDEGPGLSGSSMAATAGALCAAGLDDHAIVFFPGHDGGPGAEASATVRRWWSPGRCRVSPAPELARPVPGLRWIFGGFAAVNERLDTLARVKRARQMRLAGEGLALPCPAEADGWIGLAGEGTALTADCLSPGLMDRTLAPYLLRAAMRPPDDGTIPSAVGRIRAALAAAGVTLPGVAERVVTTCLNLPLAGDGRMAPGEWLRMADGRVLKRDATGSDCTHNWPGAQSILWDVAGTAAEWDMADDQRAAWENSLFMRGLGSDALALAFHEAGYCCLCLAQAAQQGDAAATVRWNMALRGAVARTMALA